MMDEKRFEQEYREMKRQAAPDLWARIEGNLADHPEREEQAQQEAHLGQTAEVQEFPRKRKGRRPVYGMAAAAAAVLVLVVAGPQLRRGGSSMSAAPMVGAAQADGEMEMAQAGAAETWAAAAEAGADAAQSGNDAGVSAAAPGSTAAAPAPSGSTSGMAGAGADTGADTTAKSAASTPPGANEKASGAMVTAGTPPETASDVTDVPQVTAIQPALWQPLSVPENAVTVAEDSQYFSEGILGDTELLCGATVTSASLEQDASGRAVKVVYELTLDKIYYSEDYTAGITKLTVKSPIIETDGDEAYVLYQLKPETTYLLPLKTQDGGWELLYPFAPQIQVTGDGAYVFHSGYASLVTEDTSVMAGDPEGTNDYYYDRMLLREDDNFLSDFVSLVTDQVQGRKTE